MNTSRRNILLSTLFGAGAVGLRALATGIPASILLNPQKALASCAFTPKNPQFVILATSESGDPFNAGVPGTYGVAPNGSATVFHPEPNPGSTQIQVGSKMYPCAPSWASANMPTLPKFAASTQFWHLMTNTPVHPKETQVLQLQAAITPAEMFPSFLSKNLSTWLQTIQDQPVSVGAANPTEALTFNGAALPVIPPTALKDTLFSDPNSSFNLNGLQSLRDSTLAGLKDIYAQNGASPAQQAFVNQYINSQSDLRKISTTLLSKLSTLTSNTPTTQIDAALALIQMKVTPVVSVHIPFGGDNHHDSLNGVDYGNELAQTQTGCATIDYLLSQLVSLGLQDQVTLITLNVFGRTFVDDPKNGPGRQHNPNHQASLVIGKPFKGGVMGGLGPVKGGDFGAVDIDPATGGVAKAGAGILPVDTLASWARTVAQGVGVDPVIIDKFMDPNAAPTSEGTVQTLSSVLA